MNPLARSGGADLLGSRKAWLDNRACRHFTALLCLVICNGQTFAADWPRLGGPDAAGVSPETNLARIWPTNGPTSLWTVEVAEGFAGPAVRDGEVYLLDRIGNQQDVLRCFNLGTGTEQWKMAQDAPGSLPYNGSRNVPTVDQDTVFCVGPFGRLYCFNRHRPELLWSHHLVDEFKNPEIDRPAAPTNREQTLARAQLPMWGMTQAPLLYHDLVIVAPQTLRCGLAAYDKQTGKLRWTSGYIGRNWYSHVSPYLANLCGVDQVIMLAQPSDPEKAPSDAPPAIISAIDPSNGQILWTNLTPAPDKIPIAEPVALGENRLFITGGYGMGCLVLEVSHDDSVWNSKIIFHSRVAAGHIHSPVFYRGRIYLTSFKDHRGASTGLVCLDPDGRLVWQTGPDVQFDSGPYLFADGLAFILNGRSGELSLYSVDQELPRLLAKTKVLDASGGKAWAPMALSRGKLLLRDQHQLKCLDVSANSGAR